MTTIAAGIITVIAVFFAYDISANAKGIVYTGSTEYNATSGQDFNVGVYLGGDNGEKTGDYETVIVYDENYLTYVGGANDGGNGRVSVSGTSADGGRVKVMITFHAVIGGETTVKVENATLTDENGGALEITEFPEVPVHIQAPAADAPEYIMFNGEMLPDYSADVNEYSFDIPYTENFEFSVPEGFKIITDTEGLKAGANEIALKVTQDNRTPLEYKITVNMEALEEEESETEENTAEASRHAGKNRMSPSYPKASSIDRSRTTVSGSATTTSPRTSFDTPAATFSIENPAFSGAPASSAETIGRNASFTTLRSEIFSTETDVIRLTSGSPAFARIFIA